MKRTRVQMTAAALATLMLLGGCGEAPYDLTEKEQELIVNYAAHVVTKYNSYQKEGLTYVDLEAMAEEEAAVEEVVAETPVTEEQTSVAEGAEVAEAEATEESTDLGYPKVTLESLFGDQGLAVDYVGMRIADSYVKADYYALFPDAGKMYLVLGIDITNEGEAVMSVDNLSRGAKFQIAINGEVVSFSETTLLMEDFSTFEDTLAAGETRETVLLFQIPETVTSTDQVDLIVSIGDNYQIILENE